MTILYVDKLGVAVAFDLFFRSSVFALPLHSSLGYFHLVPCNGCWPVILI